MILILSTTELLSAETDEDESIKTERRVKLNNITDIYIYIYGEVLSLVLLTIIVIL